MEDGKVEVFDGKNIMALTDSQIREKLKDKVIHIRKNGDITCSGKVVNFFQAESNTPNRSIVGFVLNNVEIPITQDMEIDVQ